MMDALECCKQHGKPVAPEYVEKLKSFTESEIIAEAVFFEQLNLTSDLNTTLGQILSNLLQGTFITSDQAF